LVIIVDRWRLTVWRQWKVENSLLFLAILAELVKEGLGSTISILAMEAAMFLFETLGDASFR
jgi:hypothetical protein